MSWFQLFNAAVSLAAAVVWTRAIRTSWVIGTKWSVLWRACSLFVAIWYFGLYFLLGVGVLDTSLDLVGAFRYTFPVLMMSPALAWLSHRKLITALATPPHKLLADIGEADDE